MKSFLDIVYCMGFISFCSVGPLLVVVCGMKMLRFAMSDAPRQYMIITFTYFFFKYDYRTSTETFLIDYFFVSILFCKVWIIIRMYTPEYVCKGF